MVVAPTDLVLGYSAWWDPRYLGDDPYSGRQELFSGGLALWNTAPLFGTGAGGFAVAYRSLFVDPTFLDVQHLHSEPMQVLVEQGIIGLLSLLLALLGAA